MSLNMKPSEYESCYKGIAYLFETDSTKEEISEQPEMEGDKQKFMDTTIYLDSERLIA